MLSASSTRYSTLSSRGPRLPARDLDHRGREVGRDQLALVADPLGGDEAGVAGARRQLEHGVARLRIEPLDEPLTQVAGRRPEEVVLALPVAREAVPGVE